MSTRDEICRNVKIDGARDLELDMRGRPPGRVIQPNDDAANPPPTSWGAR